MHSRPSRLLPRQLYYYTTIREVCKPEKWTKLKFFFVQTDENGFFCLKLLTCGRCCAIILRNQEELSVLTRPHREPESYIPGRKSRFDARRVSVFLFCVPPQGTGTLRTREVNDNSNQRHSRKRTDQMQGSQSDQAGRLAGGDNEPRERAAHGL